MSQIAEFLQRSASREAQSKGRALLHQPNAVARVILDEVNQTAFYRVLGDHSRQWREVTIRSFKEGPARVRCTCPESYRETCKHAVAALMHLEQSLEPVQVMVSASAPSLITSGDSKIPMRWIDMTLVHQYMLRRDHIRMEVLSENDAVKILEASAWEVVADIVTKSNTYRVKIHRNKQEGMFETSCPCEHRETPLCAHKGALLHYLHAKNGQFFFTSLEDHTEEKKRLLGHYGFSLEDDIQNNFVFEYDANGVVLKVLDPSLMPLASHQTASDRVISPALRHANPLKINLLHSEEQGAIGEPDFGLAFRLTPKITPGFSIELFSGRFDGRQPVGTLKGYDSFRNVFTDLHLRPNVPLQAVAQMFSAEAFQQIRIAQSARQNEDLVTPYLVDRLAKAWHLLQEQKRVYMSTEPSLNAKSLELLNISSHHATVVLELIHEGALLALRPRFEVDGALLSDEATFLTPYFCIHNGTLHLLRFLEHSKHWNVFVERKSLRIHESDRHNFMRDVVLPFRSLLHVLMPSGFDYPTELAEPSIAVYLTEREPYLVIKPVFTYAGVQVGYDGSTELLDLRQAQPKFISRDMATETAFIETLRASHPIFEEQSQAEFMYLPFSEVMRNGWFLNFHSAMREQGVEMLGFKELSRFRYNPNKPNFKMSVGSGVDWFELDAEVTFGDQVVRLADIRKAVLEKRDYVELADGTLGLLPQEWLQRYGLLLKMSVKGADGAIRVSKFHFSLLDEMYDQISDTALQQELERKRRKLQDFQYIEEVEMPKGLRAELRPYQADGYKWLRFLNEFGWGGILADDMGLGKTVQTLSLILWAIEENPDKQCLIVCPKSLIYNWQKEIEKFAPGLTFAVYHGSQRKKDMTGFYEANVILTSYGTVRTDIELFSGLEYQYVVLDESQAIKNPSAQASKAAHLLRTKNRLCLSGTPLQNNTYDLFAQLNFLNPGMLGSMEFFREQFVVPIDRQNDKEAITHLRKVVAPFILRRVKEEVAKDLPAKTETIVYCEMDTEQRKIYDAYRNEIRLRILKQIDEQGIGRSGLLILQGLTRLRQICDSPSIVKEEGSENYPEVSVKADELIREISENAGGHKALVFSQFLGMLDLLRRRLESQGIRYEYFDGASSTRQRQASIDRFQTDTDVRVFLISLKAGGVGLNLTAADYVYIVDPWWNPAVEQQAIDRTHRIGQDKAIFAYKLICRDSVEEKILTLQERKRQLAADLVSDDAAFIQKLTRDDIVFLFS